MDNKETWKKLIDLYRPNPNPSDEMYRAFIRATEKFSPLALQDAYHHTVDNETRFPTIALFRSYCDHFQEQIDLERHEKQKRVERIAAEHGDIFGKGKTGKAVRNIVNGLTSGKLTRREYVERVKSIGIDPGLAQWYGEMGYNMDDKCRVSAIGGRVG